MPLRDRESNRRRFAATLAALAAIVGAGLGWAAPALADSTALSRKVFQVGFGRIAEAYLDPVDLARLGADGLKGLSAIDPAVRVEREGPVVRLYVAGQPVGEYSAPGAEDARGWAEVTARAVEQVRAHSTLVRDASAERIYQAVFDAVTADLDGYSRYTGATRADGERAQREGYGGIGVDLEFDGKRPVVRAVTPRSPSDRAGLRVGDVITAIDGDLTAHMAEPAIVDALRGPAGSLVLVSVARSDERPMRLPLKRERVVPNTVVVAIADGIATARIERFNAATAANLRDAVEGFIRDGNARGLVLDLRGNPGGLLDQAVSVADLFIPTGRIITTEGRHPDSRQRWDAGMDDVADGLPIVVVVDGRSASSAEVVAAALQDSGRAVVVGASSFGKGSVQTVTRLPNDGELFLTWSHIYTPGGYTLHRQGVQPVVCTSRPDGDPASLLAHLRDGAPGGGSLAEMHGWRARAAEDDEALARLRDACPWREHPADLDLAVARALLADEALYRRAVALTAGNTVAER